MGRARSHLSSFGALVAVVAIFAGAFQPAFLRIFAADRESLRERNAEMNYRKLPGLRGFLEFVRAETRPGDTIVLAVANRPWAFGYGYAYIRAVYTLPDREFLPLRDEQNRFLAANFTRATYLACWRCVPPPESGFSVIARSRDGVVARRR